MDMWPKTIFFARVLGQMTSLGQESLPMLILYMPCIYSKIKLIIQY